MFKNYWLQALTKLYEAVRTHRRDALLRRLADADLWEFDDDILSERTPPGDDSLALARMVLLVPRSADRTCEQSIACAKDLIRDHDSFSALSPFEQVEMLKDQEPYICKLDAQAMNDLRALLRTDEARAKAIALFEDIDFGDPPMQKKAHEWAERIRFAFETPPPSSTGVSGAQAAA